MNFLVNLLEKKIFLKKWKKHFDKYYLNLLIILLSYYLADLIILSQRGLLLPDKAPPPRIQEQAVFLPKANEFYNSIITRNIFSSDNLIPDELGKDNESELKRRNQPVLSSLPLNLIGTIVHSNPAKSVATIELKSKNQVSSYLPERDIDQIATLLKVGRFKVIIKNANSGRLEYLEMKNGKNQLSFERGSFKNNNLKQNLSGGGSDVRSLGKNKFEIDRIDLQKYTSDLSSILQQISVQPRLKGNGQVDCYKILSIQSGSIYTQLGLQQGDCLKSVNGESIETPEKAMKLFNELKDSKGIRLTAERDGHDQDMNYLVR